MIISVGLFLGEICTYDDQCSGTEYASQCIYNKTKHDRVCSCINGYVSSGSKCIVGMDEELVNFVIVKELLLKFIHFGKQTVKFNNVIMMT